MKTKNKITALMLAVLILLMQMTFAAFATETTAGTLTPDTLNSIKVGDWYYQYFTFESEDYTGNDWSIDGELPPGMELKSSTGSDNPVISGVPTTAGNYTFKMQAKQNISGEPTVVFEKSFTWVIGANTLRIKGEPVFYGYSDGYGKLSHYLRVNYNLESTWSMEPAEGYTLPDDLKLEYDDEEKTYKLVWEEPQKGKYYINVTASCNGETVSETLKLIVIPYAGCEHAELSSIEGTAATCMSNGTPDLWYCDDCETYFYDNKCIGIAPDDIDELYTTGFHADEDDDEKCDTCGKTMPVFKKVTSEDDVTGYGIYLVVSEIDGKYYTLKAPGKTELDNIEAVEIEKNADGTFPYPGAGVMMLKTSAAAPCEGELAAGSMRYTFGATIHGVPYILTSEDYSGGIRMEWNQDASKYGYRIKLTDEKYAQIASVYSEYWGGGSGKGSGNGIFSAYEEADGEPTKRYFSFATSDTLTAKPVELYKLTYVEAMEGDKSYTLSDAPLSESKEAVTNELISMAGDANIQLSAVSGISNALMNGTVEDKITEEGLAENEFTVYAYATITAESEEYADGSTGDVTSVTYEVKPNIVIKDAEGTTLATMEVPNEKLNGEKMAVTLCVGSMTPAQIIHYKADKTEEYFYGKDSDKVKNDGAKSFELYRDVVNGNLVTFEIDSFSKIKILAAAEPEKAKHKVTLKGVGTGATGAGTYQEGATVQIYAGANSGYSFGGWTTEDVTLTGAESTNAEFTMPSKNVTVTANWNKETEKTGGGGSTRPKTYTLKFITMGGSAVENMNVNKNEVATAPEAPVRDGYDFAGWYIDKELTTEYEFTEKVTKSLTLYAAWTENGEAEEDNNDKNEEKPQAPEAVEKKEGFADVAEDDWFFANVKYVTENGLMNGTSENEFAPNNSLTRAMLVTILYRLAGEPEVNKSIPFADVTADSYYSNAVIWAQQNGIVSGISENEFAPDESITREQIATILYRYAGYKGYDVSVGEDTNILSYTDFDGISEYAISAVQYAVGSGLMKGKTESTLNPKDNATRAEIAAILQRFIEANK